MSSGLHYGAQMEVKIAKNRLNALLEVSRRGLFAKTADRHQTLLLVIQTHSFWIQKSPKRPSGEVSQNV